MPPRLAQPPAPPVGPGPAPFQSLIDNRPHRPREVIAVVSSTAAPDTGAALMRDYNLIAVSSSRIALLNAVMIRFRVPDNRPLQTVLAALAADPRVVSVNLNYVYGLQQHRSPGNAGNSPQYSLAALKIPLAHRFATGQNVVVAVIDSCIDTTHPELSGVWIESFNGTGEPVSGCNGKESHGTAIAGIIAARSYLSGVAPGVRLLSARAFSENTASRKTEGTTASLVASMDWAFGRGARLFNLSFAGPEDPLLQSLIDRAAARGAILVAAAGNAGPASPPAYPAAYRNVIAVTATDAANRVYASANRGGYIVVAAPGVDILVAAGQGAYELKSGTSYAAAHISGIIALMLERQPALAEPVLRAMLAQTAAGLGPKEEYGAGLADAFAALSVLENRH